MADIEVVIKIPEGLKDVFENRNVTALDVEVMRDAIKNGTPLPKGQWIPVSERLPEKTGRYLCTVGANYRTPREMYYAPQEWANKSNDATWRSVDGSYVYDWFVKAWMPLPEPYKEEK